MKNSRFNKILEIIQNNSVETQEELAEKLRESGIDVTQATVSRDIKELGLIKVAAEDGRYRYKFIGRSLDNTYNKLLNVFSESLISIDYANNIVVIKTLPGMGQAAAAAIDSLGWAEIVGTVAGDDTIFAVVRSEKTAEELVHRFDKLVR